MFRILVLGIVDSSSNMTVSDTTRAPNISKNELICQVLSYLQVHGESMIIEIVNERHLTRRRVTEALMECSEYGLVECRLRLHSHKALLYRLTEVGAGYLALLKIQRLIAPFDGIRKPIASAETEDNEELMDLLKRARDIVSGIDM